MPRFAVIQDGTETVRQRFADVQTCYERCAQDLSDGRFVNFSVEVYNDDRAEALLETLDPDEWACVVLASNALLSGQVESAFIRLSQRLHGYLAAGGGLVVLHQQRDDLAPVLPPELLPAQTERTAPYGDIRSSPAEGAESDVLLRFPTAVDWTRLRDIDADEVAALRQQGLAVELPSLFFKALERAALPASLKPVLVSSTGELLMCRAQDHLAARVVVATPPLDWQSDRPGQGVAARALLANAIRYASLGRPRRLVWYRAEATENELLLRWLNADGSGAIHAAPAKGRIAATDSWLLETVDAFVLPASRLKAVESQDEIVRYLERGGTLVATATEHRGHGTRVTVVIGRHEERALASQLFAELRAVDGWQTGKYAFELRNVVQALDFLLRDPVHRANPAATDPRSLDHVARDLRERLIDARHREDLGSSIALVRCLAHIEPAAAPVSGTYVDWLEAEQALRPFDLSLQIRAALAYSRRAADPAFLRDAHAALAACASDNRSLAALARVLDAIALLDQTGLLGEDRASASLLAAIASDWLHELQRLPTGGWMSVEATAAITLGLVTLYRRLPEDTPPEVEHQLVGHLATAATALRQARRRYEASPKGVSWLARLTHAVILADRQLPIGLQRIATLDWPESGETTQAGGRTIQALLEDMGARNAEIVRAERVARANLDRARQELDTAREQFLRTSDEQRIAVRIGRAVATTVPVALLTAAFVLVVAQIGWTSLGGVLANIAVLLGVLATLLSGVFALLDRWHLLAGPAAAARGWIEKQGAPLVGQLSKLKRS